MMQSFLSNIRRGLGKPYIELKNASDKGKYLDTLLYACLSDSSYNCRVEGPKGVFLYSLINLYDEQAKNFIKDKIIESLSIDDNYNLTFQKIDILLEFYENGDKSLKDVFLNFYNCFTKNTKRWTKNKLKAFEIVALTIDIVFGLKKTKTVIKFILDTHLNLEYFKWYKNRISQKYKKCIEVKEFTSKFNNTKMPHINYSLDALLKENDVRKMRWFANEISKEEYEKVINYLRKTNDIVQIKKILIVYSDSYIDNQIPLELCLHLLNKFNDDIKDYVYEVIKYYKAKKVLNLGLLLIKDKKYLVTALEMLFNNYFPKYKQLIINSYKKVPFSFYDCDLITGFAIDFMNHKKKNYPDEILLISYNKTYDSINRKLVFEIMKKRNLLTKQIIEECKHDFNSDIKAKANKILT